jgi:alpha-L-fucosidase
LSPNTAIRLLTVFADVKGAESKAISWMEKFGEWKHVTQTSRQQPKSTAINRWEFWNFKKPGNTLLRYPWLKEIVKFQVLNQL